jgi:hypothetical protein
LAASNYREVLLSKLFPGAQTSLAALQPVMIELQRVLPLNWTQRQRTLIRLDGGFGDDANLTWLLPWGYQVLAKGYSGKRALAYANRVPTANWVEVRPGQRWLAWSPLQLALGHATRTLVVRWLTPQAGCKHALYITTLCDWPLRDIANLYDDRGGMEVEIQTDKAGLLVAHRRKHQWAAQEMLILLNDWAHNLLAWFRACALCDSRFADFGPKRIIRDLFTIPGQAVVDGTELIELRLQAAHPYAAAMTCCLERLWQLP